MYNNFKDSSLKFLENRELFEDDNVNVVFILAVLFSNKQIEDIFNKHKIDVIKHKDRILQSFLLLYDYSVYIITEVFSLSYTYEFEDILYNENYEINANYQYLFSIENIIFDNELSLIDKQKYDLEINFQNIGYFYCALKKGDIYLSLKRNFLATSDYDIQT